MNVRNPGASHSILSHQVEKRPSLLFQLLHAMDARERRCRREVERRGLGVGQIHVSKVRRGLEDG